MKQTAVEWLYNEIKHIIPNDYIEKFDKAKEMENQNIIDTYNNVSYDCGMQCLSEETCNENINYKITIPKEEPKQDMEKTAVEWLEFRYKNNITLNQYDFEEAKKIEEENICDAYNEGLYGWDNTDDFIGIDYYNKKFKNK